MSIVVMQEEYIEFDHMGEHFRAHYRVDSPKFYGQDKDPKYMRAYVSLPDSLQPSDEPLKAAAKEDGADTHYTVKGEHPNLDKAWQAFNHAELAIMKSVLQTALEHMHKRDLLTGVNLHDATYSRRAGCSCGCSPGFIVRGVNGNHNLWVERYNEAEETERRLQAEEARMARLNEARWLLAEKLEELAVFDLDQEQVDKLLRQLDRL